MNYNDPTRGLLTYEEVRDFLLNGPHDRFADQEIDVRLAVHDFLKNDPLIGPILFTDPVNDTWHPADCLVFSGGSWVWIEAKGRTYRLADKNSWMIDQKKIDSLRELSVKTKIAAAHVTLTADDHCLLWPIDAPCTSATMNLPVKSYNESRGTAKKEVLFYATSTAHELQR